MPEIDIAEQVVEAVEDARQEGAEQVQQALAAVDNAARLDAIEGRITAVESVLPRVEALERAQATLESTIERVEDVAENTAETVAEAVDDVATGTTDALADVASPAVDVAKPVAGGVVDTVSDVADDAAHDVSDAAKAVEKSPKRVHVLFKRIGG